MMFLQFICRKIIMFLYLQFPNSFKEADKIPVCKKKLKLSKKTHRTLSDIPNISNIFVRCLYDQISK